jgi:hypothetical protein
MVGRDQPAGFWVNGHYCPTDCNPETDARPELTVEWADTREEAETLLLWYPDGVIDEP